MRSWELWLAELWLVESIRGAVFCNLCRNMLWCYAFSEFLIDNSHAGSSSSVYLRSDVNKTCNLPFLSFSWTAFSRFCLLHDAYIFFWVIGKFLNGNYFVSDNYSFKFSDSWASYCSFIFLLRDTLRLTFRL